MTIMTMLLQLAGGLGLFLLGMNLMSEGLEKAAGAKLRRVLEVFTTNRFLGMIVGIIVTGIIQSSSACTVMVVSFVNSGLMNLLQAAGVIFGANIGTTVTSQLVSFKFSEFAPIFLFIGVIATMFFKNGTVKKVGSIILGFGVLFQGLVSMSDAMSSMRDMPEVINILKSLTNPYAAVLVGLVITAIIQSSSVTVSIVLLMAQADLLSLGICLYIILGCNIGSCGSALIASLAGKKDAKRAAMIHFLFNVIGTMIIFTVLQFLQNDIVNGIYSISSDDNGRFVANAHTIIKITQVIMLFPFSKLIVKLAIKLVPGEDKKVSYRDNFQLKYIGEKTVFNPATAVVDATNEMERMADLASENLNRAMNALITLDQEDIDQVYEVEQNIDFLNRSITRYLVQINQMPLPIEDLKGLGSLFHVINDIERIGDHAENVADAAKMRIERGLSFSKEAQAELGQMLEMVNKIVSYSIETFSKNDEKHLDEIVALEDKVDNIERELQQRHVERLTNNECTPEAGMIFSDVISGLERVADHATNIAFSIFNGEREKVNKG